MAESVALTTPVLAKAGVSTLRPSYIGFHVLMGTVIIQLTQWTNGAFVEDGRTLEFTYNATTTPTGQTVMRAANKANNSIKSMERRILEQLIADHPELSGTIAGTPD
jgi:hypothetical protein